MASLSLERACELLHEVCQREWARMQSGELHPASAHAKTVSAYIEAVDAAEVITTEARLVRAIVGDQLPDVWVHPSPGVVIKRLG